MSNDPRIQLDKVQEERLKAAASDATANRIGNAVIVKLREHALEDAKKDLDAAKAQLTYSCDTEKAAERRLFEYYERLHQEARARRRAGPSDLAEVAACEVADGRRKPSVSVVIDGEAVAEAVRRRSP